MDDRQYQEETYRKHLELVEDSKRELEIWDGINSAKTVEQLKSAFLAYMGERPEPFIQTCFKPEDITPRQELEMISDDDDVPAPEGDNA